MDSVSHNSLLLRGARIIGPDRAIEHGALMFESGRIARIFENVDDLPAADSVLDLAGLTLFPGFIDAHIHGAVGVDTMTASADDLRRVAEFLARNGVTAWLPTLVPSPREQYERAISAISGFADSERDPTEVGTLDTCHARILGVHYEGPFVNSEQCGALPREHFRTFSGRADVDSL